MKPNKILYSLLAALLAAAGFYYVFWPDLSKYLQMRRQNILLDQRIAEEERKELYLKKEQEGLTNDSVQIEKVAREKLGLSRPKDIIYKFEDTTSPQPPSESSASAKVKH